MKYAFFITFSLKFWKNFLKKISSEKFLSLEWSVIPPITKTYRLTGALFNLQPGKKKQKTKTKQKQQQLQHIFQKKNLPHISE